MLYLLGLGGQLGFRGPGRRFFHEFRLMWGLGVIGVNGNWEIGWYTFSLLVPSHREVEVEVF